MIMRVKLIESIPSFEHFQVGNEYDVVAVMGENLLLVNENKKFGEAYPRKCEFVKEYKK
jgi:hypothetical protein